MVLKAKVQSTAKTKTTTRKTKLAFDKIDHVTFGENKISVWVVTDEKITEQLQKEINYGKDKVFEKLSYLQKLELLKELVNKEIKNTRKSEVKGQISFDDYDGDELRFNEDGEAMGSGSVWDYPDSPYLDEGDDIY